MDAAQVRQLRAVGCVIGGASLLFLAYEFYGEFARSHERAALAWCLALGVGALCAFALAVVLRRRS